MQTILFQGDSITDAGRSREDDFNLGRGYPVLVSASLGFSNPGEYKFYNRGISGNRIVDVYARIKSDILNIKPDVMSILIGVNDVWHEVSHSNGVDACKFEKIYSMLIEEIKEELPDIKIIILAPFVLKTGATEEKWDYFISEVTKRCVAAKNVADKYNLAYVSLQDKFDEASKLAPANYWLGDGVHPTFSGHELIKNEWLKAFNNL